MKIIQVCPRYPPRSGGVETHVRELSKRLDARGHDVIVVTADRRSREARKAVRNGIEICRHHGLAPGGAFHLAPGIVRTVRRLDGDVVHGHNYHSLPLLFAARAAGDARFLATPHYHGGSASSLRDRLLALYRPLGARVLRGADEVIAVSDWEAELLASDFGLNAEVIPNGVDVERFAEAEPLNRDRPYLLCVGRLESYKGVQHVIRALPSLRDYDLVVAGSGPHRDKLEQVARDAGVIDRVDFQGYVGDDELPGLYAGASVHVTLSSFEAYGMTVGEALAAGTPCVVRERSGLLDWTSMRGCVGVAKMSPEAVADAVREAVDDTPDADSLPTWDHVADRVEALYRD